MNFPSVTPAAWREQVEKELKGAPYEKLLVQKTIEGLAIAPLYTEAPALALAGSPPADPFRICMRHAGPASAAALAADLDGGAEALWLSLDAAETLAARANVAQTFLVLGVDAGADPAAALAGSTLLSLPSAPRFALDHDPLARGDASPGALARLAKAAHHVADRFAGSTSVTISTLPYHDAGADAADEIAIALSTGVLYLETLLAAGFASPADAAAQIALRTSADRDTFLSLCKVRALRACWQKLLVASGVTAPPRTLVHVACSARTLSVRDPWVNMLRVTTQLFAAVLGGADLVTPAAFDEATGDPSDHGRRVARNTGLVLREESYLGKVHDPAGGSYYLETLTDALAREAWSRFQTLEKEGGIADAWSSGRLAARLEATWKARLEAIAKRRAPVLGVSEFANLGETLPAARPASDAGPTGGLARHRDAEAFEALRTLAEQRKTPPEAVLVTLGTLAESRGRVGFAAGFFAAGGIASRETTTDETASIACLCGTDERYAEEAAARAKALKAAGCTRVLLAGRPGALEADLRAAGVDGFIFVGCDVVATLEALLGETV